MLVRRPRESIPFGGHIKKAAFKAAFQDGNKALQRYATMGAGPGRKNDDDLDDLDSDSLLEDSDESVSQSSSDSKGVSVGSFDIKIDKGESGNMKERLKSGRRSRANLDHKLSKKKSLQRLSSALKKEERKHQTGPINNPGEDNENAILKTTKPEQ